MFLEILRQEARKSNMHHKHGAGIICGSSILGCGHNVSLFDTKMIDNPSLYRQKQPERQFKLCGC